MGDDGEIDFSDYEPFRDSSFGCDYHNSAPMEDFMDELLKGTRTCTHAHTCNPPGPDNTHTHTCFHTHTQLFVSSDDEKLPEKSDCHPEDRGESLKRKRPLGNREAVRKHREKKKAQMALLEEQVNHLKMMNQQLLRCLQRQASLEAEGARLRAILSEFRGRIDTELGSFPYAKYCTVPMVNKSGDCIVQPLQGKYLYNAVSVPCDADVPCLHDSVSDTSGMQRMPDMATRWNGACDMASDDCWYLGWKADVSSQVKCLSPERAPNNAPRIPDTSGMQRMSNMSSRWNGACNMASDDCRYLGLKADLSSQVRCLSPERAPNDTLLPDSYVSSAQIAAMVMTTHRGAVLPLRNQ